MLCVNRGREGPTYLRCHGQQWQGTMCSKVKSEMFSGCFVLLLSSNCRILHTLTLVASRALSSTVLYRLKQARRAPGCDNVGEEFEANAARSQFFKFWIQHRIEEERISSVAMIARGTITTGVRETQDIQIQSGK